MSSQGFSGKAKGKWSMTVMMNARDLSRDDDFLSHMLVENLGVGDKPLTVHKMDPTRRFGNHDTTDVLAIVRKHIVKRSGWSNSASRIRAAVDALLELPSVRFHLRRKTAAQINAFATHASRYLELYLPTGSIEISHTSRYSHRTGKPELCILATRSLKIGQVITDLKGSLAHLTPEEDEELKRADKQHADGIRRDFSVIHSNQKNRSHLFLGPARFVNHDCDHNVELFRDGRIITFRVIKPIAAAQEVTAHYGDGYFGKSNRHCLCATCESLGRGGYAPAEEQEITLEDDSSTDEDTRAERIRTGLGLNAKGNPNERRTRRGVYAIMAKEDTDDEDRVGMTEAVAVESCTEPHDELDSDTIVNELTQFKAPHSMSDNSDSSVLTSLSELQQGESSMVAANLDKHSIMDASGITNGQGLWPSTSRLQTRVSVPARNCREHVDRNAVIHVKPEKQSVPRSFPSARSTPSLITESRDRSNSRERPGRWQSARLPKYDGVAPDTVKEGNEKTPGRSRWKGKDSTTSSPAKSKSATPVASNSRSDLLKAPQIPRPGHSLCCVCHSEIPLAPRRNMSPHCSRCLRHRAIYGAEWPSRIAPDMQESDDSEELDSDSMLVDSTGRHHARKRRRTEGFDGSGKPRLQGPTTSGNARSSRRDSDLSMVKSMWSQKHFSGARQFSVQRVSESGKNWGLLSTRPSPNALARRSWSAVRQNSSSLTEEDDDDDSVSGSRRKTRSRKKTSEASNVKPIGRTFYMKDENKRMPKGWVVVSASSSEIEETEEETEKTSKQLKEPQTTATNSSEPQGISGLSKSDHPSLASTPSLAHTSSAASTPAESSSVSVEDTIRPSTPQVTATFSPHNSAKSISTRTNAIKLSDPRSPSTNHERSVSDTGSFKDGNKNAPVLTPSRRGRNLEDVGTSDISMAVPDSQPLPDERSGSSLEEVSMAEELFFRETAGSNLEDSNKDTVSAAAKISSLIHATAISYGHPDARRTWKPAYHFADIDAEGESDSTADN